MKAKHTPNPKRSHLGILKKPVEGAPELMRRIVALVEVDGKGEKSPFFQIMG